MTKAKTRVIYTLLVNCYINKAFYVIKSFIRNGHVTVLLQPSIINRLTAKYFNWQSFFSLFSSHTLWPPWMGLWFVDSLFGILVFLISQPCPYIFWWNLCYYFLYVSSTSTTIYILKLLHKPTTEHTLHSRVKSSITQN